MDNSHILLNSTYFCANYLAYAVTVRRKMALYTLYVAGFVGCVECDCNGHGDERKGFCNSTTGVCFCKDNTRGEHCEQCVDGYYGNPR